MPGRSYRAGDNIWLGELGNDLLTLQLEPLTIQGDPRTTIVRPCPDPMLLNRPSLATESVTPGGALVARA
jgi:hypothetical protein